MTTQEAEDDLSLAKIFTESEKLTQKYQQIKMRLHCIPMK
jgi:hypothetical protein